MAGTVAHHRGNEMFRLTIETDNAAFERGNRGGEIARILHALAGKIEADTLDLPESGPLTDHNGNTVGRWGVTP